MIINLFLLNSDIILKKQLLKLDHRFRSFDLEMICDHDDISNSICVLTPSIFSDAIVYAIRECNIGIPIILLTHTKRMMKNKLPINECLLFEHMTYHCCKQLLNKLPDNVLNHAFEKDVKNQSIVRNKLIYSDATASDIPTDSA